MRVYQNNNHNIFWHDHLERRNELSPVGEDGVGERCSAGDGQLSHGRGRLPYGHDSRRAITLVAFIETAFF